MIFTISLTLTSLPKELFTLNISLEISGNEFDNSSTIPGEIIFTLMPSEPNSSERTLKKPSKENFPIIYDNIFGGFDDKTSDPIEQLAYSIIKFFIDFKIS